MSDDLSREIGLALADLERMAPPAPALDDIKSRRTVLYAVRPRRRWSSTAAVFAAAAVTVAVVLVAALVATNMGGTPAATDSTSTSSTPTAVVPTGTWLIESVTVAGTTTQIDATATIDAGYEPPRVTFVDGRIEGWTGCNEFSRGPVQVVDRLLTVGDEGFINAASCPEDRPDFAIVEDAVIALLFPDEVRIDLAISEQAMAWSAGGTEAKFSRTGATPTTDRTTTTIAGGPCPSPDLALRHWTSGGEPTDAVEAAVWMGSESEFLTVVDASADRGVRFYLRADEGLNRGSDIESDAAERFMRGVELPSDAVFTGFETPYVELWWVPSQPDAVYLQPVSASGITEVELWPEVPFANHCH